MLCAPLQKIRGKMKPATSLVVVGGGDDLVSAWLHEMVVYWSSAMFEIRRMRVTGKLQTKHYLVD